VVTSYMRPCPPSPVHSILTDSSTIMTKVDGGYRVSGHKVFGTGSAVCHKLLHDGPV